MKTHMASSVPLRAIKSLGVNIKDLITRANKVNFTSYEVHFPEDKEIKFTSGILDEEVGTTKNHLYYCLEGDAECRASTGETFKLEPHTFVALKPNASMTLHTSNKGRIFVTYVETSAPDIGTIIRKLSEIVGTDRDVDLHCGRSRRFLTRSDGFNMSFHNTIAYAGHTSPLWYQNNVEAVYYVRGDLKYTWEDGRQAQSFYQDHITDGDGCVLLMDNNDPHEVHALSQECECLCLFFPALAGNEKPNFDKSRGATY